VEIEAKFRVPDTETLERLKDAAEVAGFPLGPSQSQEFADTYLDTESRSILLGGYYCRRRLSKGQVLITLKALGPASAGGAVHRREEFEVALEAYSAPAGWPESVARDKVLELSRGAALVELLELRQTRTRRLVGDLARPVAELSLDLVRVNPGDLSADGEAATDGRTYFEVEVELKGDGSEADLTAIAAELQASWGLEPEPRSKFDRALEAVGEAPLGTVAVGVAPPGLGAEDADAAAYELDAEVAATAEAAGAAVPPDAKPGKRKGKRCKEAFLGDGLETLERPGLQAGDSMAEAARKTLLFHLQRMMLHEPGTREGEDPEELHDMRVATRRMRAALRVFEDHVAMEQYKPFLKVMRETGRELGAVRDLDVFMIKTQAYIDSLPEEARPGLDPLVEAWRMERERARVELLDYLDSDRYERFKEKFEAFLRVPNAGAGRTTGRDGEPMPSRVGDVLPGVLFDRLALVRAYDGPITQPDAPLSVFHQLRISSKGLRYTLEFFQEVLGTDSKPLIDRMKQVQDHLGDLQDAVVTCDVLLGFLGSGTWGPPQTDRKGARTLFPVNAPGVATYLAVKQSEIERLMHTFGPLWDQVRGAEFSRPLAKLVGTL
jgi:CHAD domain-containing protein